MAERVGFEPTLEFPLNTLSKRAHSTALPSLRLDDALPKFTKVGSDLDEGSALSSPRPSGFQGTRDLDIRQFFVKIRWTINDISSQTAFPACGSNFFRLLWNFWSSERMMSALRQHKLEFVLLPWLATAIALIVAKWSILYHDGYTEIALSLHGTTQLGLWEKFSLYHSDLLSYFVSIPLAFSVATFWFSVRLRMVLSILMSFFALVLVSTEATIYKSTGAFSSFTDISALISWTIKSRDIRFLHLQSRSEMNIAGMFLFFGLLTAVALWALPRNHRWLSSSILALLGLGVIAAAATALPRVPAMPWSDSFLKMAATFAFPNGNPFQRQQSQSVSELIRTFRGDSHTTASQPAAFTGKAKGYNVILFVMEAITAEAFNPASDSLADMPNVRRLRDHSLLMETHYTSYPLSNAAAFSIFTSIYSKTATGSILSDHVELPGLIRNLRNAGYDAGYYGFVLRLPSLRDDRMLASLGFDKIVEPMSKFPAEQSGAQMFFGPPEYTAGRDHEALLAMCAQIRNWTKDRQKFAAAFFPEIGHEPYRDLGSQKSKPDLVRGRALAVYQDAWMGEIIDELQRDGALDHTVIVLTSDHGMRTDLSPEGHLSYWASRNSHGKLEDIVMHVPMLIYVPGVVNEPFKIDTPTSHIDIAPTLLDLLGGLSDPGLEEGSPVYSAGIENRRLFLPMDMYGASGFYYGGNYYSRGAGGVVYESPSMEFGNHNVLRFDSKEADSVRKVLANQDAVQTEIVNQLVKGNAR